MGRGRGDRGAAWPNPGIPGKDKILRKTQFFAIFPIFDGILGKDEPQPSPPGRPDPAFIELISALGVLILPFQRFSGTRSFSRCHQR